MLGATAIVRFTRTDAAALFCFLKASASQPCYTHQSMPAAQRTTYGFAPDELRVLRTLNTPAKVQDFLNAMPFNFEHEGDTCRSPRRVLRDRTANCMEGAMFAAAAMRLHGHEPLL